MTFFVGQFFPNDLRVVQLAKKSNRIIKPVMLILILPLKMPVLLRKQIKFEVVSTIRNMKVYLVEVNKYAPVYKQVLRYLFEHLVMSMGKPVHGIALPNFKKFLRK